MLTVCPRLPDLNALFFNLLDKNTQWISDEAVWETEKALYQQALHNLATYRKETKTPKQNSMQFFDQCREPGKNLSSFGRSWILESNCLWGC